MWTRMQCSYKTGLALSKRCNCDHTCNKFAPPFCNSRKPVTEGEVNEADHLTQNKTIRFSFSFRDKNGLVSFIVTGWRWHELQESSPPGRSQCGGSACPVCVPALTRAHSRNVPPQYDLKEMKCHTWGMLGTLVLRRRGLPQATSGVWPSAPARPFQGKTREGMCRGPSCTVLHWYAIHTCDIYTQVVSYLLSGWTQWHIPFYFPPFSINDKTSSLW